jgi:hypothetical protein
VVAPLVDAVVTVWAPQPLMASAASAIKATINTRARIRGELIPG